MRPALSRPPFWTSDPTRISHGLGGLGPDAFSTSKTRLQRRNSGERRAPERPFERAGRTRDRGFDRREMGHRVRSVRWRREAPSALRKGPVRCAEDADERKCGKRFDRGSFGESGREKDFVTRMDPSLQGVENARRRVSPSRHETNASLNVRRVVPANPGRTAAVGTRRHGRGAADAAQVGPPILVLEVFRVHADGVPAKVRDVASSIASVSRDERSDVPSDRPETAREPSHSDGLVIARSVRRNPTSTYKRHLCIL